MQTGTTLPPGVPLAPGSRPKGELLLRVGPLRLGTSSRHPSRPALVTIRWWGDAGPGTCLSLAPGASEAAVFPICCGPKYLIRYLKDMSSLVLHVDEAGSMAPLGRCVVDVRFLDVSRPVAGTFPVLLPQGVPQPSAAAPPHSPAMQPLGTLLRHMGTLDVRLDLGFSSATTSSFELNEHLAAQHMQMLATPRPPPSAPTGQVAASAQVLPPARHSHTQQLSQPAPSRPVHASAKALSAGDSQAEDPETPELLQVDLCQPLLTRLLHSFQRFCEVYDRWKGAAAGQGVLTVPALLTQLKARGIIEFDMSPVQSQYLAAMLDPLGDLPCDSMDEVLLAVRQALEAGLRVRSGQLEAVVTLLAPLALALQQSMVLVRKAFRQASGAMHLGQLVDVLRGVVPVLERQQVRYLFAILVHLGPSMSGGQWSGSVVIGDVQAFMRLAESWGTAAQYAGADELRTLAAAASPSTLPHSRLPAPSAPGPAVRASPTSGSSRGAARALSLGAGAGSVAVVGAGRRSSALQRLKDRMQGSRSGAGAAPGEGQQQQQHGQQGPASAGQYGQPLLPPYQPPVPTFKSMQPPPFPSLAPVQQHEAAAAASLPASTPEPVQELVRQAEALRHSLAQVAGQRPPLPGSSRGYASHRSRDQQQQEEDEALQALRYVTVPHVASDIVKGVLRGRPQSRRKSRRAAMRQGLSEGEGDGQRGGKRAREWRRGAGSDGSLTDSGDSTGSGGWEGSSDMSWEEEQEAAEWSEQQLLAQLFFPKAQAPEADADGLMAPQRAGVQGQDQDQPGAAAAVGATTPGSKDEGAAQLPHMSAGISVSPRPTSNSASGRDASAEPQLQVWVHSLQLPALSAAATDPLAGGELSVIVKCPLLPSLTQRQHHALPPRPPSVSTPEQPSGAGAGSSALLHLSLPAPNPSPLPCPLVLEVWQQRTQLVGLAALSLPPAAASQPTDAAAAAPSAASPAQPPAAQAPPQPAQTSAAGWQLAASSSGTFALSNPLTPENENDAAAGGSSSSIALTAALHTPTPQPPLSPAHALAEQADSRRPGSPQAKAEVVEVQAVCHSFRVTVGGARHLADTVDLKRVGQAVPLSRFLRYQYPGDAEPLFTEDVPCSGEPIFAASAVHSVTLTPEQDVGQALESLASAFTASEAGQAGSHQHQPASTSAAGLRFEVWDRWPATVGTSGSGAEAEAGVPEAPSPTLLALAVMPISQLADLARRAQQQQQQSHGEAHEASASGAEQGTESGEGRASTSPPEPQTGHVPGRTAEARASPAASACTLLLPLQLMSREDSAETVDAAPVPLLEVQLQYEAVPMVMAVPAQQQAPWQDSEAHTAAGTQHATDGAAAPDAASGATAGSQGAATASASAAPMASVPQPVAMPKTATLSVQIVQACGLQAAVYEAQAWMGSSAALLGRAHLVGPNPYASLVLVQGGPLKGRLPKMQTPYLAQSFCPEYHWQGVVSLSLDPPLMEALATQHLCVELWHHTSRSLAAALSASPLAPALLGSTSGAGGIAPAKSGATAAGGRGGMGVAAGLPPPLQPGQVQDVLLGCATHPLLQLLSKPQGINAWLPLKSQRGEPVGAVQLAIGLTHLGDKQLDVCPDAAPPLVQAPWLLDLMPAAALQHVVAQAPWTLLGAQPSQLAALNESLAAASTAVATDPYAAEPAQTPAGGEAGGGQAVPWKGGLPPAFGGQWSRLTLHVDQVVLPSPGAAAELRPKAYKYYATYMLPGSDDEVHTAAQVARMQQGGTASASGGPSLSTATASAKPGVSSSPATWHVPLQHCGVHWVRADEALAAALVRLPLRLRVWRAHGRVARGGSSTPSAAGPGNPALSGPQSGGPWLSSVLSGEAQVDLSALVSAAAVRRHQPNTRWLSGSFTVVDPAAKLFTNSRVQVRVLLELLPTTLPPASWLDRTAWQPQGPPLQQGPAQSEVTDPVSAPSQTQAQSQDAAGGGREVQEEANEAQAGSSASPRIGAHVDAAASAAAAAAGMEGASEAARAPSPPSAALPSMSPPGDSEQPGGTGRTVTSLVAPSFMIDDDFMFSFRKDAVPVSLKPSLPTAGEATEGSINSAVDVQQPLPSEGGETTQDAAQAAGLLMEEGSVDAAAATAVTEGAADSVSPALREVLRRQLQELELLSLGWQTRLGPHNGTEGDRPQEAPAATSTPNSMDRQASAVSGPAHAVGHPTAGMSPWVEGSAAAQPSSSGAALQQVVEQLPPASAGKRPAPYVAATCSEDEDDCVVWGGGGGSDTDDTDELLAAKSSLHPGAPPRPKVRAAEAGLKPGTTLTSLSFPSNWGRARDDGEGGSGEGQRPEITGLQQATGVNNLDDWLFGFSRPAPTPTAATESAHVPTSLPAQLAAVHPLFNNAATEQPAAVTSSSPAMAIQVPTSPAPMHPFLSSPQPSPAAPHLRHGQPGRAVLNQEGGHAGSSMTAPAASGEEHHARVPKAATVDQEAVLPALLPVAPQPEMLAGLSVDAGVEVQRVQLPECAPSAPRIRFANTLPAIQLDFKLTYMG